MPLQRGVVIAQWLFPSLVAILVAWMIQKKGFSVLPSSLFVSFFSSSPLSPPISSKKASTEIVVGRLDNSDYLYATWVIGDLHGDVDCAKYWVEKTGLIKTTTTTISSNDNGNGNDMNEENDDGNDDDDNESIQRIQEKKVWTDPTSHLVFMGDYVDKGPQSRQVIEFVKSLTDEFPLHVTALMGNHEMELLLDRNEQRWNQQQQQGGWGPGTGYFGLAYSSVHPGEYLNYVANKNNKNDASDTTTKPDEYNDTMIVEILYNVSAEVYGHQLHQTLRLAPEDQVGAEISALKFITDAALRKQVSERLKEFQSAYLDTYRSDTELGQWLERRPIVAQINDTIFVHGGISNYGSALLRQDGVDNINELFFNNSHETKLLEFMTKTQRGQIMYDMLTFRGNHKPDACTAMEHLLPEGATKLGVGHTPGKNVRIMCNGNFFAIDSSLGRWFRNSGNLYCTHPVTSSNGHYVCQEKVDRCEGQIIKLTATAPAEIIQ